MHPARPAAEQPVVLREPNFFTDLAERACAWEAEGGFWKAASYALRFFALIGSFLSIIGIPFYILADREITLLSFEGQLRDGEFIVNPQGMRDLEAQVNQRTQERDAQIQLVEVAQANVARLTEENTQKDTDIQRLSAENATLTNTVKEQATEIEEAYAALDKILGERADEHAARKDEQQDVALLVQEFNTFKQDQRAELLRIKARLTQAVLLSPQKQKAALARLFDLTPVKQANVVAQVGRI